MQIEAVRATYGLECLEFERCVAANLERGGNGEGLQHVSERISSAWKVDTDLEERYRAFGCHWDLMGGLEYESVSRRRRAGV